MASGPATENSWRGSPWDDFIKEEIFDEFAPLFSSLIPVLEYDFGPDGQTLNRSVNSAVFVHRGGAFERSGQTRGAVNRSPFYDVCNMTAELRARDGEVARELLKGLANAVDKSAHGRAGALQGYRLIGGRAGDDGVLIEVDFQVKIDLATPAQPTEEVETVQGQVEHQSQTIPVS